MLIVTVAFSATRSSDVPCKVSDLRLTLSPTSSVPSVTVIAGLASLLPVTVSLPVPALVNIVSALPLSEATVLSVPSAVRMPSVPPATLSVVNAASPSMSSVRVPAPAFVRLPSAMLSSPATVRLALELSATLKVYASLMVTLLARRSPLRVTVLSEAVLLKIALSSAWAVSFPVQLPDHAPLSVSCDHVADSEPLHSRSQDVSVTLM